MEIVVPAAGLSSRFPNMRPKYTLVDYKKRLMLELAVKPFIGKYNITIGVLKEHQETYNVEKIIKSYLGNSVNIIYIDELTKGPADTVYQIIKKADINESSPILIKDCDNFFDFDISTDNYVCVSKIQDHNILRKVFAKSFVVSNNQEVISSIVEKSVVSDTFCVGGYGFKSAKLFCESFENLNITSEIFVSHVIQNCIQNKEVFVEKQIQNYIDVGTAQDWFEYNDKPVIFCDIDGTIIKAQGHGDCNEEPILLQNNVKILLECCHNGSQIVFTSSRLERDREATEYMLSKLGFNDFQLILNLQNTRRIIINDYNDANPFPRAEAINIKRDSDNLKDFL